MPSTADIAYLASACREGLERSFARLSIPVLRLLRAYDQSRRRRADEEVLRHLNDHLLKDSGYSRHEIRRAILARRAGRNLTDGWGA